MNVNCLAIDVLFSIFEKYGFCSDRTVNKFANEKTLRSDNGLVFLSRFINSFMALKVEQYVDLDIHGIFICSISEARVINNIETMTYTYYQNNVKPKLNADEKKDYVYKVCGFVYEGEELPEDFVFSLYEGRY